MQKNRLVVIGTGDVAKLAVAARRRGATST